jgi:hypothetical protein
MARVMPSSASQAAVERTTFVGAVVPPVVKRLSKSLAAVAEEHHSTLLKGEAERKVTAAER